MLLRTKKHPLFHSNCLLKKVYNILLLLLLLLLLYSDAISIKPASDVINISNNKIGDTVTVDISIETCLTNVIVSIYKGKDRVYNGVINNNQHESFIIHYPLNIIDTTCTGQYGVRVYGNEFTTPLTFFNVTGQHNK